MLSTTQQRPRVHRLDYLRGISAFAIMAYHYSSWTFGELNAGSFLGKIGIYGVAIFYILSGQTLGYVYDSSLVSGKSSLLDFYKKRFFRIYPLLWLATFASIVISKKLPNFFDVFLNLTGLFGLVRWNVYFATGAWSIGNELVFYLIFPVLIFLVSKRRFGFIMILLPVVFSFLYFSFIGIKLNTPLSKQWEIYTNPLNQILFFVGGYLIGAFTTPATSNSTKHIVIGILGLVTFITLPVNNNPSELVSGVTRLIMGASCAMICYSFNRLDRVIIFIDKPLTFLGQSSYSLYLLHPIVYAVTRAFLSLASKRFNAIPTTTVFIASIIISLVISYFSFEYFEKYFIKLSRSRK